MYTLTESWIEMFGSLPDGWDGSIYCTETDAATTIRTNKTQGFMAAYSFTLVKEGWLTFIYNGHEMTLHPDDLYIYSPGMGIMVVAVSENYRGYCLLADENTTFDTPNVHDLVHIAYQPVVQLHEPKVTLTHDTALRLTEKMQEIISYLRSDHIYKSKILHMLYSIFLLDLQDAQRQAVAYSRTSQRKEDLFIDFIRLLPRHFRKHHDLSFYASQLHISTVYLSRVVREVSGRTVVDYINQQLITEAAFLLRTSRHTIGQIADQLCFADVPSFSKFFSRHKGISPRVYREQRR